MQPLPLVPLPDVLPAPAWLFRILDASLFMVHLLLINIIVGGSLLLLAARLRGAAASIHTESLAGKLPVVFALAITMGVAPLLFLQVVYGHLFYSSSILMGVWWIAIIPMLIIAYYAAYVQAHAHRARGGGAALTTIALACMTVIVLVIAFLLVSNNLLMMRPADWPAYFQERGGTILASGDRTRIPRYLHILVASVAVAGLFSSLVWSVRARRGDREAAPKAARGLLVFGTATIAQIVVGLLFFGLLPRAYLLRFLGGDPLFTAILAAGICSGFGAIGTAFAAKLRPTVIMALITIAAMVTTRDHLRTLYLEGIVDPASLPVILQTGPLVAFLVILLAGAAAILWMLRLGFGRSGRSNA